MATLVDIAAETRTSVSTVSRVLTGGSACARISPATRARIVEAAQRLGYRPNLVARSLRTRRSQTVALLVSDIANPWFGQIASLVEQSLHRHGYSLMLCNSGEDAALESEYLQLLPQKGIDGLILVPVQQTRRALLEALPEHLPLVLLDRPIAGIEACVCSDQEQAANLLCDSLQRAGVRRVALVCGPAHVVTHRRRGEVAAARFEVVEHVEGPAQKETGRQAWIKLLGRRVDAVVATNNFLAQGVLDAMESPRDPPVIGCFDEIPLMHLLAVPMVSVVQDVPMLAEGAVRLLLAQLQGQAVAGPLLLPARAVSNAAFQQVQGAGRNHH
jgi:LacI family transcriptional regulator